MKTENKNDTSMNLADALESGTSADELLELFKKDLNRAQEEVKKRNAETAAKKQKDSAIATLREIFVKDGLAYLKAIGVFDEDTKTNDKDVEFFCNVLERAEKNYKMKMNVKYDNVMDNDIIDRFLEGLF